MNAPWMKRPRRVELDRAALDDYMAIDKMAADPIVTGPSRQVLAMIEGFANIALAFDGEYNLQVALMQRVRETLTDVLGYRPPDEDQFEIHFLHLMSLIDGQRITEESGTRVGEEQKDWEREIEELLVKLAGSPT